MKTNEKIINILQKNYGVSYKTAKNIILQIGLHINITYNQCNSTQKQQLTLLLDQLNLNNIKKTQYYNIYILQKIKSYKGIRHLKGLPVRGQRTHTNHKTQKYLTALRLQEIRKYKKNVTSSPNTNTAKVNTFKRTHLKHKTK